MDYPQRTRLKILGHARVEDARQHPELVAKFAAPDVQRIVERIFFIDVVSFDWNCPKYITPRYTAAESRRSRRAIARNVSPNWKLQLKTKMIVMNPRQSVTAVLDEKHMRSTALTKAPL